MLTVLLRPFTTSVQILLLLCSLVYLGACRQANSVAQADQPTAVAIKLATVRQSQISDTSEYVANLDSRRSITLQPRVEGQISQILIRPGEAVKSGTALIQIDPARQRASVNRYAAATGSAQATFLSARANTQRARASLANAQAELTNLRAERQARTSDLKLNRVQFNRYKTLQTQGAVSKQVLDEYTNRLDSAASNLNALDARIQAQQAEVQAQQAEIASQQAEMIRASRDIQQAAASTQEQREQLNYFDITAPFTGYVGDIPIKVGDFVDTSTRLLTLTQNNPLEVNVQIPTETAARLRMQMPIEILNAQGKPVGVSRIFFIASNTSNTTQSILVKALLNNSSGQLKADQQVRARVIWSRRPGLSVPTAAISRIAGQSFVFVAQQKGSRQIVQQRPVTLGDIQGNQYQVKSGLKAGDRIAVSGLLRLSDGAAITPES